MYSIDLKSDNELHEMLSDGLADALEGEVAEAYEEDPGMYEELFLEAEGRVLQAMDRAMEAALDEERRWLRDRILEGSR